MIVSITEDLNEKSSLISQISLLKGSFWVGHNNHAPTPKAYQKSLFGTSTSATQDLWSSFYPLQEDTSLKSRKQRKQEGIIEKEPSLCDLEAGMILMSESRLKQL